jgi:hypothetical protein
MKAEEILVREQEARFAILRKLYEDSDGNPLSMFSPDDVAAETELDTAQFERAVLYLAQESLLELTSTSVSISHNGIVELEQALKEPAQPTVHFLPLNQIQIGTMIGSTIHQGTLNNKGD